jgi:hypothetical protein
MNWKCSIVGVAAAALMCVGAANASVIYNNGAPNGANGNEATNWTQTEDFSFGSNTVVGGAGVYLGGDGSLASWDGHLQYTLWSDNAGDPGALLASGEPVHFVTDTGPAFIAGGDSYLVTFNFLTPFTALGGQTYHLGIHTGAVGNNNRDDIYWVTTALNSTNTGRESYDSMYNNWSDNGQEHAFYLTDGAAVPEPAEWALLLMGFAGLGAALRVRRRLDAAAA